MQLYNKERDKKYILVFLIIGLLNIFMPVIRDKLAAQTETFPPPLEMQQANPPHK